MKRQEYEEELKRIQEEHLRNVSRNLGYGDENWQPCLHDQCPSCHGTGVKSDGSMCVHCISCPCPKCTPRC